MFSLPEPSPQPKIDPHSETELEKLRLEVAELRWKLRWFYRIGQIISIASVSIALAAFVVSLVQYNRQTTEANQREMRKPVWEKRLNTIYEISNVVGTIAAAEDPEDPDRSRAETRFWQLYSGPAILAEDKPLLSSEIVDFGNCVLQFEGSGCEDQSKQSAKLPKLAQKLTNAFRVHINQEFNLPGATPGASPLGSSPEQ